MYAYDPLDQEQAFVPEYKDDYDQIKAREKKKEKRIEFIALVVLVIFAFLLFIVALKHSLEGP